MIEGVRITDLKIIEDNRGSVMHMLKDTDPHFEGFGEIYFATIKPMVVKAWHLHKRMWLNYAAVSGNIQVGLIDLREGSPTFGEYMDVYLSSFGPDYRLLTIPPGIWNGFRVVQGDTRSAIVANCATEPHDSNEIVRVHPEEFPVPYDWGHYEVAG